MEGRKTKYNRGRERRGSDIKAGEKTLWKLERKKNPVFSEMYRRVKTCSYMEMKRYRHMRSRFSLLFSLNFKVGLLWCV